MILIQYLHSFSLLVYTFMAGYILLKDPKSLLNRTCAALISSFAIWNIVDVFATSTDIKEETAILFQNISSIGWISFSSILLCFSIVFSKNEKFLKNKWFLGIILILPLMFIYGQWTQEITGHPVQGSFGWEFAWEESIWSYLFYMYYISFTLASIYIIYKYGLVSTHTQEKYQAKIMVVTLIISLICGTITDVIIPLFHIRGVPQIGNVILLVFAGGMIYAIVKYKFLRVTPALAADNIISTMEELLILSDERGSILNVNNAVSETLKYDQKELMGRSIEVLFGQDDIKKSLLEKIIQGEIIKNCEADLKTSEDKKIPVIISCSPLKDSESEIRGMVIIARDITERKNAEEVLFEGQRVFRSLVENSPDIIARYDVNCQRTYVNPEYLKTAQIPQPELISTSPIQRSPLPEYSAKILQDLLRRVLDTGIAEAVDLKWPKADNIEYWYNVYAFPEFNREGSVISVMTISRDITKSRQAEIEIARVNRALRMLSDSNQALIHITDEVALLKEVCRIAVEVGGYCMAWVGYIEHDEAKTLRPITYAGFESGYIDSAKVSWGDNERGRGPGGTAIRTGQPSIVRNIPKDPTFSPWKEDSIRRGYNSIIALPLISEGKTFGAIGIYSSELDVFDTKEVEILKELAEDLSFGITLLRTLAKKKQAEEDLQESEKKFHDLFDNAGDAILIADVETALIIDANKEAEVLLRRTRNEIIGINRSEIHPAEKVAYYDEQFRMHIASGHVNDMESEIVTKDGKIVPVRISAVVIDLKGRKVIQGFFRDNTERKQTENDLIKAKEKAEESDRLKSAFLANISHEIRTPMNGILGFAGLLAEPHLTDEKQQEYIHIIEQSGKRMLNIINDIVDISKIESGQMKVHYSSTNINEQIQYLYIFFKPEAEKKGLQIFFKNTLPDKEAIIKTDKEKVYAILTNLIKNAIKFTYKGSVEFGYMKKGKYLEFFIKDTGVGIRQEQKELIFERFRQGSESYSRNYEGAGLGLSISKAYVEMLGGTLWLKSELENFSVGIPGESTFYFTLPYNTEPEEITVVKKTVLSVGKENQNKRLKILIAEDDETSEKLISIVTEKLCNEVLIARTGVDAVLLCRKHPDIDLILMDNKMPDINGYEATRQIRLFNKDVVIIAQTAFAHSGEKEKALKAGCNEYISKPIIKDELHSLIQKYFKNDL